VINFQIVFYDNMFLPALMCRQNFIFYIIERLK